MKPTAGFTLVELLAGLAVFFVLITILLAVTLGTVQEVTTLSRRLHDREGLERVRGRLTNDLSMLVGSGQPGRQLGLHVQQEEGMAHLVCVLPNEMDGEDPFALPVRHILWEWQADSGALHRYELNRAEPPASLPSGLDRLTLLTPAWRTSGLDGWLEDPAFLSHREAVGQGALLSNLSGFDLVVEPEPEGTVVRQWSVEGRLPSRLVATFLPGSSPFPPEEDWITHPAAIILPFPVGQSR